MLSLRSQVHSLTLCSSRMEALFNATWIVLRREKLVAIQDNQILLLKRLAWNILTLEALVKKHMEMELLNKTLVQSQPLLHLECPRALPKQVGHQSKCYEGPHAIVDHQGDMIDQNRTLSHV